MSNICRFGIRASGGPSELFSLQSLLERGRDGLAFDGDIILNFERLFPEEVVGRTETGHPRMVPNLQHTFLWIHNTGELPMARNQGGIITLRGSSKWNAPYRFLGRLSMEFRSLDFFLWGCTEHTEYETWHASNGLVWSIDEYSQPCDHDGEKSPTWLTRDTVDLDTGKAYRPIQLQADH